MQFKFARFLVPFCRNFYLKLQYWGFYKTKRCAEFSNFRVISMRFAFFLRFSVRCLYISLCGHLRLENMQISYDNL